MRSSVRKWRVGRCMAMLMEPPSQSQSLPITTHLLASCSLPICSSATPRFNTGSTDQGQRAMLAL